MEEDAESYEAQEEEEEEKSEESEPKDFDMQDYDQDGRIQLYIETRKNHMPPKKPLSSFFIFSHNFI